MGFGVGIVAEGTGVWLQNRGAGFSLTPGHRNALAPGKRPYHTIIPGMALKDGELWASFGVMGGFMQPQGHFQVISAMVDDELNPQEALNRPRWMIQNGDPGGSLLIEEGTPFKTMADLAERGHRIQPESGLGTRQLWARADHPLRPRDRRHARRQRAPRRRADRGVLGDSQIRLVQHPRLECRSS